MGNECDCSNPPPVEDYSDISVPFDENYDEVGELSDRSIYQRTEDDVLSDIILKVR
jgi:hypothetical protein